MIAVSNELNALPVLQPLNNVAVRELPAEFQELLDSAKPLTIQQFAPRVFSLPYWLAAVFICVQCGVGLIEAARHSSSASSAAQNLIFTVPFLLILAVPLFFAVRKHKYKMRVESGQLRLGVFVHKDALLIRTGENSCTLLPRDFLSGVVLARYYHNKHIYATKLIFVDSANNEYPNIIGMHYFGFFDMFDHFRNLSDALKSWKPELKIVEKS
jgi:fumarate reductase subunit D